MINLHELVYKVNGAIEPIGETGADAVRYTNLQELIKLVDMLINDIDSVKRYAHRYEASMSKAGKYAGEYIHELCESLKDGE